MKLLLIGHSVEDHIHRNGKETVKPGGIYYSVLALQNFKEKEDEIFLCTSVSSENQELFPHYSEMYKEYFQFSSAIPKVNLIVDNVEERHERYENIVNNLDIKISDFNFDGILINMITGFDITIEQLKNIRKQFNGMIYLDVHTLSRGIDDNYNRNFRTIPDVREWLGSVDIVQVNNNELLTLSNKKSEIEIADEVLGYGVKILIVTKGELGARIFCKEKNEIISVFKSAKKVKTKSKIGCGDVFGAIFFYSYIKNNDQLKALETANAAAAVAASYENHNDYLNLKKDVVSESN